MSRSQLVKAFVGLGANLEHPQQQLTTALQALVKHSQISLVKTSSFYRSAPMGPQAQDDYINAVALIETKLGPLELLKQLQIIEKAQGRVRNGERWGPRTLDLDLLLYHDQQINLPQLIVPHYGLKQRNFVILPLWEIAPELTLPDGTPVKTLAAHIEKQGIKKL